MANKAGAEMREHNLILKTENSEMRAKLQNKVTVTKPDTEHTLNSNDTKNLLKVTQG